MDSTYNRIPFEEGPVVVGLMPGQDGAVVERAAELAATLNVPLLGAFVDPASYLVEWIPGGHVDQFSLEPVIDDDDETAGIARELAAHLDEVALAYGVEGRLRVVAGERALALGRLAESVGAAVIVVGARRPGLAAKAEELVGGSLLRRLAAIQHTPVLAIPGVVHAPRHG